MIASHSISTSLVLKMVALSVKSSTNATKFDEASLALVNVEEPQPLSIAYNEKIRPVLDALENLRRLNIAQEGIQLPTIVVVGAQSYGKSSVLYRISSWYQLASRTRYVH
jgi:hypothetical protein